MIRPLLLALVVGSVAASIASTHTRTVRAHGDASPLQKVVSLLGKLEAKIVRDGEAEQKAYDTFEVWCQTGAKEKQADIKNAKSIIEELTATIGKADSDLATLSSKIQEIAADISANDADVKAATAIREKERTEFVGAETELKDTIDTLDRAMNILERKMHGSALLQSKVDRKDIGQLVHILGSIVDAASLSVHDRRTLVGLVQSGEQEDDGNSDSSLGAPDPAAYKKRSESIIDVLEDLKQKAVTQLEEIRREENNARHNFDLLKQSLDDQIKVDEKELNDAKMAQHDASETRASAQGDLEVTQKDLEDAQSALSIMQSGCATRTADHEAAVKNRAEELKALAEAKKALLEMTNGADSRVYNATFFLQVAQGKAVRSADLRNGADLANFEVVNFVRKLAREQNSATLAQLVGQISSAMSATAKSGTDPFMKVKALISAMLERLIKEAGEEASHKAYCDKELPETQQKMDDLKYDIEKYTSKLDKTKADSVQLKDELSVLQRELAEIAKSQADADAQRLKEQKVYVQAKADLEQGLSGVRMALRVLREYYESTPEAAAASSAASLVQLKGPALRNGGDVIALLEVVEADFSRSLASTEMIEEGAATAYEKFSTENRISKELKEKEVQYKMKTTGSLDKAAMELSSDSESSQTELGAVTDYSANIRSMCEAKTLEERAARREAEIAGLKEALQILEGEAVLLQRQQRRRGLRLGAKA